MKEIKFRAWDRVEKQIVTVDILNWSYPSGLEVNNSNVSLPYTLMQYTGLKDKNGKPIYEGDVVKVVKENDDDHGFNIPIGTLLVIKWMDGGFRLIEPQHYNNEAKGFCEICASKGYLFSENHEMPIGFYSEVTGNIYENPELLK